MPETIQHTDINFSSSVPAEKAGADAPVPSPSKPARPDHVPEKFWDAEKGAVRTDELLKSYSELEKTKEKPKEVVPPETEEKPAPDEKPKEEPTEKLPAQFEKFQEEFTETGELSEESYAELESKFGHSRQIVDTYIAGIKARTAEYHGAIYAETGGEEGFKALSEWANENVSKDELSAVDEALASGDKAKAAVAIRGLYARYTEENGREPVLLGGDSSGPSSGVVPFKSRAEVVAAMSDPRYKNDPAYRDQVAERLDRSTVF